MDDAGRLLMDFVGYTERNGADALTTELAVAWAIRTRAEVNPAPPGPGASTGPAASLLVVMAAASATVRPLISVGVIAMGISYIRGIPTESDTLPKIL
jgi:hypothetical protein